MIHNEANQIDQRNRLRAEAGLPLLDGPTEAARLAAVQADADFEVAFAARRDEFAHAWANNADGWMASVGRYSAARQQVRSEQSSE
jgi:hypothetical protein